MNIHLLKYYILIINHIKRDWNILNYNLEILILKIRYNTMSV